jgi:hypothetical protein
MTPRVTALCASLLLALSLAAPAVAQEEESSWFSGAFQLDVTNAYFFRGILQEREGVIIQPWLELYANLYSSEDGFLRDFTIGAGSWNSFHSERTGASDTMGWWYESDYYPLISMDFAGGLSALIVYYWYDSPNNAFNVVQEANIKLMWDDSEYLPFSFAPWVNLAVETSRTSFGSDEGVGLQAGVAPTLFAAEDESFTLTLPVEVGLSIDDYYERASGGENAFGYFNAGFAANIPLGFVPEGAGEWYVNLSAKYFFFNDTLENANRGKNHYPVGMVSLGVAF